MSIKIERVWAMPNKNTFDIHPIKKLINEEVDLNKVWIDPFANKNKIATFTNDLNPDYDTDYHLDALDFLKTFDDSSIDGVLYDPPYSPRQVSECYNDFGYNVTWDTTKASFWSNHKKEISRIVKKGGKVITFGWNSGGIGKKYGFKIERILLVPHGGWHNDTICTVEIKVSDIEGDKKEIKMDSKIKEELEKLPIDYWDFKNYDTKEYTHGLHNYPAVMVSPISRNIIKIISKYKKIEALFDPFSGSGTVLVEGQLANIPVVQGTDINPLALLLTRVKTTPIKPEDLAHQITELKKELLNLKIKFSESLSKVDEYILDEMKLDITDRNGWGTDAPIYLSEFCKKNALELEIPSFKNIGYWFKPRVILELAMVKNAILKIKDESIRDFIFIAFSESIRLVSNRRNGEFKMFRIKKEKIQEFNPDVFQQFLKILENNEKKMNDFYKKLEEDNNNSKVDIFKNSACSLEAIKDNTFDLVITSPPYGDSKTTVAYGEYSRLSLQWINLDNLSDKEILSVDKTLMGGIKYTKGFEIDLDSPTLIEELNKIKELDLKRAGDVYSFYKDLDAAINSISKKTKKDGYQFWVVGNRRVKDTLLQTDVIISELAIKYGLETIHTINRNIPNKVMPSLNSPSNISGKKIETMTMEHIVILKKI